MICYHTLVKMWSFQYSIIFVLCNDAAGNNYNPYVAVPSDYGRVKSKNTVLTGHKPLLFSVLTVKRSRCGAKFYSQAGNWIILQAIAETWTENFTFWIQAFSSCQQMGFPIIVRFVDRIEYRKILVRWVDPRLTWQSITGQLETTNLNIKQIWTPDLVYWNRNLV